MRSVVQSLFLGITFALHHSVHCASSKKDIEVDINDSKWGDGSRPPVREVWYETSRGSNVDIVCPYLSGMFPAFMTVQDPNFPDKVGRKVVSSDGKLELYNVEPKDSNNYFCFYTSNEAVFPTVKIHLHVNDVLNYIPFHHRSRRSMSGAARADDPHHRGHADHSKHHSSDHHHASDTHHASNNHQTSDRHHSSAAKGSEKEKEHHSNDPSKNKENDAHKNPGAAGKGEMTNHENHAVTDNNKEEKDANEVYDGEIDPNADVVEPPSSPDITQLSDTTLLLKWTSGSLRDKGVKGYKIEYLKGNITTVFGGPRAWHIVANRIRPKFRTYKVKNLEPGMSYRFRVATIYAGKKYIYGLSSGWIKMERWS